MSRNYKKYRNFVIDNFQKFLNNEIDNATLNQNLHIIQDELGYNTQRRHKAVRITFRKTDVYGCTINRIWSDLEFGKGERENKMRENLEFAIKNPKELVINYD